MILPTLSKELKIPAASTTCPASAFSLVLSSNLLIFERLANMYGGYIVYFTGLV